MWRIFDRMLKERTQEDKVEYFGLIPRIYALCQRYAIPHQPLCVLYSNIIRCNKGEFQPEHTDFLYDLKALCQAIKAFYAEPLPSDIEAELPQQWRKRVVEDNRSSIVNIRFTVKSWDEEFVYGYDILDAQTERKVQYGKEWQLSRLLYPLATLNLLDTTEDAEGVLHPRLFILEPDYLIDITAVCQCLRGDVVSPMFYLMDKFMPREETLAIQLGNAANQFLDDAVSLDGASFLDSMQKNFRDYPLRYCTLDGVDEDFFAQCRIQHDNIQSVVHTLFPQVGIDVEHDGVQLEPSFISDVLGLQGRMDLLSDDLAKIVELKSGKQDEYHHTFKLEHAVQMALYKEILHYNLGRSRSDVKTLLLYSRYPYLHDIRLGQDYIVMAMNLRNGIVHIDRLLRTDPDTFLHILREEDFNPQGSQSRLYQNYVRPRIQSFLNTLNSASPLEYDYFCTMVAFVQREQTLAKMGDDRPDSDRGFAQAWLCDTENKRLRGNIITNLRLHPVIDEQGLLTHLHAIVDLSELSEEQCSAKNFREGDSVILYERNSEHDRMTNHQTVRCYIEELHPEKIRLRLGHPQRGTSFLHAESHYAIEPAHSDALFSTLYRGLYALLSSPLPRRNLLLGLRKPERDTSIDINISIDNKEVEDIVRKAIQCKDYYLLIGPPGSGKTNIALRSMVEEMLARDTDSRLLLMAYTNRAVDEICQMLEQITPLPQYLRIGQELTCAPAFRHRLIRNSIADLHNRKEILQHTHSVRIFCGTIASLSGCPELLQLYPIHTAIIDEASQVLEPQLMPLLCAVRHDGKPAIERWIMIGDHKQLPAVVSQRPERSATISTRLQAIGLLNCRESLFERLHRHLSSPYLSMLTRQGRMHSSISRFVCEYYYGGRLGIVPLPHQTEPQCWKNYDSTDEMQSVIATRRMAYFNIVPDGHDANNKTNSRETESVGQIVWYLHQLTIRNKQTWNPARQVGIIVPFRSQIAMVKSALQRLSIPMAEDITIDTVERYQGSQRDAIIFSTVIRQSYQLQILSNPVETDGQQVDRKLNVAITRARRQFFLVGNVALLRQATDYARLISYMDAEGSR